MFHSVGQAYPLWAVLGAGTLMEEGRGDTSVSGLQRLQEDSGMQGEGVHAKEVGTPTAQTVGLGRDGSHLSLKRWRNLFPTLVIHGVGQTDTRVPNAEGQCCCWECCAEPNPEAAGSSLPPSSCPDLPTLRRT